MKRNHVNLAHALRTARLRSGMSTGLAARRLRITETYVFLLEAGTRRPGPELLRRICDLWKLPRTRLARLAWPEFWRE